MRAIYPISRDDFMLLLGRHWSKLVIASSLLATVQLIVLTATCVLRRALLQPPSEHFYKASAQERAGLSVRSVGTAYTLLSALSFAVSTTVAARAQRVLGVAATCTLGLLFVGLVSACHAGCGVRGAEFRLGLQMLPRLGQLPSPRSR